MDLRAPWKAAKDPEPASRVVRTTLYTSCETLRVDGPAAGALPAGSLRRDPARGSGLRDAIEHAKLPEDAALGRHPGGRGHAQGRRAVSAARGEADLMWLDSHAHLTADEFDADREEVLARAREAGVEAMIAIGAGYGVAHNLRAAELAARDARIFATVGVHPHDAAQLDDEGRAALRALARAPARGGGRRVRSRLPLHERRRATCSARSSPSRWRWRARLDLPVSIHVRGDDRRAYEELLDIWQQRRRRARSQGVLHCYTGTLAFARRALDAGFYVSFSGILTFKKDRGLREVAAALPLDRLLVETDAPLLAPEGHRGKRNEPAASPSSARRWRASTAALRRRWRASRRPTHGPSSGWPRLPPRLARLAMTELDDTLALARRLAREAGAIQRERYETQLTIETKSAPVDLVTEVDTRCEALIVEALHRERPADAILAEEGSGRDDAGAPWRWVIDPLDGTMNFAHGYPRFCVSIGVEREGVRSVGVVYDPLLDELFQAVRGDGAFRNDAPIRVSRETELGRGALRHRLRLRRASQPARTTSTTSDAS